MNKGGQQLLIWGFVGFLLIITLFALIEPLKENLNGIRGASALNCPGTSDFNNTLYTNQTSFEHLVYRPTCFVTGLGMVYFVGSVLIATVLWVFRSKK
jgi:hypothetical protein